MYTIAVPVCLSMFDKEINKQQSLLWYSELEREGRDKEMEREREGGEMERARDGEIQTEIDINIEEETRFN